MNLFVVMGVSGCGKSSVARELAAATGGEFLDADDFHPASNREKMTAGIPLRDEDRWGWLDTLSRELKGRRDLPRPTFLACSALRRIYRERLSSGLDGLVFLYLQGSVACIKARLEQRKNHFMSPGLLESQFAILEEPEEGVTVSIDQPLSDVVEELLRRIRPMV